jgi:hypothetical protein
MRTEQYLVNHESLIDRSVDFYTYMKLAYVVSANQNLWISQRETAEASASSPVPAVLSKPAEAELPYTYRRRQRNTPVHRKDAPEAG